MVGCGVAWCYPGVACAPGGMWLLRNSGPVTQGPNGYLVGQEPPWRPGQLAEPLCGLVSPSGCGQLTLRLGVGVATPPFPTTVCSHPGLYLVLPLLDFILKILFYVYGHFVCTHVGVYVCVYVHHAWAWNLLRSDGSRSYSWLGATVLVLGTEPWSFRKNGHRCNH